jgi:tetratricopeptide (TPR) repeat protein
MKRVALFTALICQPIQAAINEASPEKQDVVRGDVLTLDIRGDNLNDAIWYLRGKAFCKNISCDIDTGEWQPGVYDLDVVAQNDDEINVVHFTISVDKSPPVYQIKKLKPDVINAESRVTRIKPDDLWIQALQGRLTRINSGKKTETHSTVLSPTLLHSSTRNYIPTGSLAIIGTTHPGEEFLVSGPSELKKVNRNLEVSSGQAFWRRLPKLSESDIAYDATSEINLGPFSTLTATQPGDTYIRVETSKKKMKLDIFAIGSGIDFACGNEKINIPESSRISINFEASEASCKILSRAANSDRQDLLEFYRYAMPSWFGRPSSDLAKFWLKEFQSLAVQRSIEDFLPLAQDLALKKQWGAIIDVFSASTRDNTSVREVLYLRGRARFEVGLLADAEKFFLKAYEQKTDDADIAFQLGRLKFAQGRFSEAQSWFEKAARNDYKDPPEAERRAAESAFLAGQHRNALIHNENAILSETDETKIELDRAQQAQFKNRRVFSADIDILGNVQSHVLPINPVIYGELPNLAQTNRGLFIGMSGDWQRRISSAKNLAMQFEGQHNFMTPLYSTLAAGSYSDHKVAFQAKSALPTVIGFDSEISFATQLRGGDRQVDSFSGKVGIIGGSDVVWNLGLMDSRSLDPAPGGADIVDARLNRLVGEVDHSHFDVGVTAGLRSTVLKPKWQLQATYQTIDFRTEPMDDYDATELKLFGQYDFQLSKRWSSNFSLTQWQRKYQVRGSDQWLGLDCTASLRTAPLWNLSFNVGYFSRTASDEIAAYQGHHYGLALGVEL